MEYKEYKARITQKNGEKSILSFATWRGDIIENIIKAAIPITAGAFSKGDSFHIEIVPDGKEFVYISEKEMEGTSKKVEVPTKKAKWIPKVGYTSREDMIAYLSGEDVDEDLEDLYEIGKYNEVEIAVVRKDNKPGLKSDGWDDENKITLFSCDSDMETSDDEEADKTIKWWKEVANTIADALNRKKL